MKLNWMPLLALVLAVSSGCSGAESAETQLPANTTTTPATQQFECPEYSPASLTEEPIVEPEVNSGWKSIQTFTDGDYIVEVQRYSQKVLPETQSLAAAFAAETCNSIKARGLTTLSAAKAAGFVPTPGADSHWFSPQAAADGRYLDPTTPEFLMFDGGMDSAVTQGAMFVQEAPGNRLESPFDSAVWSHYHSMPGGACFEHGIVSETKPRARRCPSPLVYGDESPDMMHVWFVAGVPAFSTSMTSSSQEADDHHHS